MTSVKILQYIGDCLCDVCLELAKHRRIMLVLSSFENLQSILVDWLVWWCLCDFYKDLAILRRLSLWLLLRSCKTSAIVFVTSVKCSWLRRGIRWRLPLHGYFIRSTTVWQDVESHVRNNWSSTLPATNLEQSTKVQSADALSIHAVAQEVAEWEWCFA